MVMKDDEDEIILKEAIESLHKAVAHAWLHKAVILLFASYEKIKYYLPKNMFFLLKNGRNFSTCNVW